MATTEPVTAGQATTNLQNYANQLYKSLIAQAPTIDYTPRTEAQLRDNLLKSYQASYDQSINNRRQTTRQNRGAIDSDAASRGIGSSTWVTDAKLRQNDNEARDLTSLRANRDSTIAQQLAAALGNQEDNQLAVKQYNASLRATALNNALSVIEALPFERIAPQHGSIIKSRRDAEFVISHLRRIKSVGIDYLIAENEL